MRQGRLDRIDLQILSDLQENGRITNVDLAKRAGISAPPCLRRVRALEEGGYIRGYHAQIVPESLGYCFTAFAQVGLSSQAGSDLEEFKQHVAAWEEVRECHMLSGETDFLLKIVVADAEAFQRFITHQLTVAPKVSSVKTSITIGEIKYAPGVPVNVSEGVDHGSEETD